MNATELFAKIKEAPTGAALNRIFDRMRIAEEEISAAQERHPERSDEVWAAFRQLQPTEPLKRKSDQLYRQHCAELLDRVAKGKSTTPSTKAEILGFLSDLSFKAPLTNPQAYLYFSLVCELEIGSEKQRQPAKDHLMHSEALNRYWKEEAEELQRYLRLHVNQEPRQGEPPN